MLRHIVLFQFISDAKPDEIGEILNRFANLRNEIDELMDFEWGLNNSPENLNDGLTHCFVLTFKDEADRNNYLPHPAHQEFVKFIEGKIEKVVVVDYAVSQERVES